MGSLKGATASLVYASGVIRLLLSSGDLYCCPLTPNRQQAKGGRRGMLVRGEGWGRGGKGRFKNKVEVIGEKNGNCGI